MRDNVIAIDGPAASGKSSAARKIAERLGIPYINTGNMYRAVTYAAMQAGFEPGKKGSNELILELLNKIDLQYKRNSEGILELTLNGKSVESAIRAPEVAKYVSFIAAIPEVREWLVASQRQFAELGMIVMEGRDIGTVVFPNARFKFYLTASPEVRAIRRLNQDGETPDGATVSSVAAEIAERDRMDMTRKVSPLKPAKDAIHIDSSDITLEEVLDLIEDVIKKEPANGE